MNVNNSSDRSFFKIAKVVKVWQSHNRNGEAGGILKRQVYDCDWVVQPEGGKFISRVRAQE